LLTQLYLTQDVEKLKQDLRKRKGGKELNEDELKELTMSRRKADLILSYGKQAIRAIRSKGLVLKRLPGFSGRRIRKKMIFTLIF
jgi:hypothetical protein